MEELVIEKVNKVGSVENGTSAAQAQADLLKLLSQSRASGGITGTIVGNISTITAAQQSRQNSSQLIRSYEALLQNSKGRVAPQTVNLPGPTRRRKKKRRRQPDMPKKACTPFMHFCAYFKRKLMEEGKEFPQFADFGKRAGELWRNMGDEEKVQFNELSELDRKRYIKDMKEYEERKLAEKEREIALAKQRDEEIQAMREKEMERMQQQQREQMEQQQKHMEQQKSSGSNTNMLNMMNPLSPLSPIMLAALNQSLMQTVLTNPELLKTMYNEQIKNYYFEQMKSLYQVANINGANTPITSQAQNISGLTGLDMHTTVSSSAMPSPLSNIGMNFNLLSLLRQSQLSNLSNSNRRSPSPKTSSPSRPLQNGSPIISPITNNLTSAALDLSASRGACSSDEDTNRSERVM